MSNEWVDEYMKLLAKHEGTKPAKATEGGGYTRGYGITTLAENFVKSLAQTKGVTADELSDKELAREYVIWNAQQIEKKFPNYNEWPSSVKMSAVDIAYNGGNISKYKGFSSALSAGDYEEAAKQTLDIVSANDPKTNKGGVLRGLANRRVDFYNRIANQQEFSPIQDIEIAPSSASGKQTHIAYNKGDSVISFDFKNPLHSASGRYDTDVKKKTEVLAEPVDVEAEVQPFVEAERRANQQVPAMEASAQEPLPEQKNVSEESNIVLPEEGSFDALFDKTNLQKSEVVERPFQDNLLNVTSVERKTQQDVDQERLSNIQSLIQKDADESGPVATAIREEQLGVGSAMLFTDTSSEIWGAAFRQMNPVLALSELINQSMAGIEDDPSYDAFSDPQLSKYQDSMWRFYDSKSKEETYAKLQRLDQERKDQTILSSSYSLGPQLVAASLSPTMLAPIAPLRAMRASGGVSRFATGAAYSGGSTALEQSILLSAKEDYSFQTVVLATGMASVIGGSINSAFGRQMARGYDARIAARDAKAEEAFGGGGYYKSAGAAVNPDTMRKQAYEFIEDEALRETGTGAEKIPFNPVLRMLKSNNPFVRQLASEMVDMGGLIQKKIGKEVAQSTSVESKFNATYVGKLVAALRGIDEEFLSYRGVVAKTGDVGRSFQVMGTQIKDKVNRTGNFISNYEFRNRVGMAMRRNGKDKIQDAATPYVEKAAKASREHYDFVGREILESGIYEAGILKAIRQAEAAGQTARLKELKARLDKFRTEGFFSNNAESFLNRVYRQDIIAARSEEFRQIIRQHGIDKLSLTGSQLNKYVDDMYDSITRQKPFEQLDEATDIFDDVSSASSLKMREFDIADELIEDFLESDIEVLMRHHTKNVGMDVEIHKAFGSVDMKGVIKGIEDEFARLIDKTSDPVKKEALRKEMLSNIKDIRGLRDRLRGTYGASKDPHQMSSRFVRTMKSFNVIVGMGGATISSIPDMARGVMVEGFNNVYKYGLKNAFRNNAKILKTMQARELQAAGVAADAALGLRASAFADLGDVFGSRTSLERAMNGSTGVMFLINGLNYWNQFNKEFVGNITSLRMNDAIMSSWTSLSRVDKEKLLKNGIDESMHRQMREMIEQNGEQVDGFWMPNTDLWSNQNARLTYRAALNQQVNRAIITPGAGDRALWTSTEVGSLLTQFKSYGQSAVTRLLISGLQEKDTAFWQGAFLLVGLAAMVNEIKRLQYGIDRKESFDTKLINAIERSGILGSFMDVSNAIEKISGNKIGVKPALTNMPSYDMPIGAQIGATLGPTGSNLINFGSVAKDVLGGNVDQKTMDSLQFITPYASLPGFGNAIGQLYELGD